MVKDGLTVILGGLKKENKIHVEQGIPYLMDIPFFGKVFRNSSDTIERTEIVIFITPHIITGGKDYEDMRGTIKSSKLSTDDDWQQGTKTLMIKD